MVLKPSAPLHSIVSKLSEAEDVKLGELTWMSAKGLHRLDGELKAGPIDPEVRSKFTRCEAGAKMVQHHGYLLVV
jgi:hypothetical protein